MMDGIYSKSSQPGYNQDADSGLSLPSGTFRSSFNSGLTSRLFRSSPTREHDSIQSILRKSLDSPLSAAYLAGYTSSPRPGSFNIRPSSALGESFSAVPRTGPNESFTSVPRAGHSSSSEPQFRSQRYSPYDAEVEETTARMNLDEENHYASSRPLSTISALNSSLFHNGLKSALNDSETRRSTLLDKLREAQETLKLQASRLTKMESDYHSTSYQVEELKSQEGKLNKQIETLEKHKKEMNELRMRDLDVQINLQQRVKELEDALQNIASDFQLLEADHARRRELVEQLSTTVELVEEENRRLHKNESIINTEVNQLKQEVTISGEEQKSLNSQLDSQKRETAHWREETEKQQNLLRQSQDMISELKIKLTNLFHKLDNMDDKERQLTKDNEVLRSKDSQLADTLTDLKSKVAILSSDKERLYQEKTDERNESENIRIQRVKLQEELSDLQLKHKKLEHETKIQQQQLDNLISKKTELAEELQGSQKVGEKLSTELTRSKESVEKLEEELQTLKSKYFQTQERLNDIHMQKDELQAGLNRTQLHHSVDCDKIRDESRREITSLQRSVEQLREGLEEKTSESKRYRDSANLLQQRLNSTANQLSAVQQEVDAERKAWQDKLDMSRTANMRREEEVSLLSHKNADYESQIHKLCCEVDHKSIDYENYHRIQDENIKLQLSNKRLTQESQESSQMLQLVQTQRDIYARNISEYSSKNLQSEQLIQTNKQLELEIVNLREQLERAMSQNSTKQEEYQEILNKMNSAARDKDDFIMEKNRLNSDLDKLHSELEKLQKENENLRSVQQENYWMKNELDEMSQKLTAAERNKTVIDLLGEQNSKLQTEISQLKESGKIMEIEQREMEKQSTACRAVEQSLREQLDKSERRMTKFEQSYHECKTELDKLNLASGEVITTKQQLEVQLNAALSELNELKPRITQLTRLQSENETLQLSHKELSHKYNQSLQEITTLRAESSKLVLKMKTTEQQAEQQFNAAKMMISDLNIAEHEKSRFKDEARRLESTLKQYQSGSEKQLMTLVGPMIDDMTERLKASEDGRTSLLQKLHENELKLSEASAQIKAVTERLAEKSSEIENLLSELSTLQTEIQESTELQERQEEVIAALKEETSALSDFQLELKDMKRTCKELHKQNQEYRGIISDLRKDSSAKQTLEKQMIEISSDLDVLKLELHKAYNLVNQKELESDRLQKLLFSANLDADNSEEKVAELKIRLDQAEKAKDVTSSTLQERIHCLEAELQNYRTEVLKLERQLSELKDSMKSGNIKDLLMEKQSLISLEAEKEGLEKECSRLRNENSQLRTEHNHVDSEKRQSQLQLKEAKMDLFKTQKEKTNLEQLNNKLDSSLSDGNRLLTQITSELENTRTKLTSTETELNIIQSEYQSVKEELSFFTEQSGEQQTAQYSRINHLQQELSESEHQLRELQDEVSELQRIIDQQNLTINDQNQTMEQQTSRITQQLSEINTKPFTVEQRVQTEIDQSVISTQTEAQLSFAKEQQTETKKFSAMSSQAEVNSFTSTSQTETSSSTAMSQTDQIDEKPERRWSVSSIQTEGTESADSESQTEETTRESETQTVLNMNETGSLTEHHGPLVERHIMFDKSSQYQPEPGYLLHETVQTDIIKMTSKYVQTLTPEKQLTGYISPVDPNLEGTGFEMASPQKNSGGRPMGRSSPVPGVNADMNESNTMMEPDDPPTAQMNTSLTDFQEELLLMDETGSTGCKTTPNGSPDVSDDMIQTMTERDVKTPAHGTHWPGSTWWERNDKTVNEALFLTQPDYSLGGLYDDTDHVTDHVTGGTELMEESNDSIVTEEDDSKSTGVDDSINLSSTPALTRDKTLKIFKQLQKAKQRSKKCLAPPTKRNLPLEFDLSRRRRDSFEDQETATPDMDVEELKNEIISKSGKVEWRGDPREPHRRYLSSWDLSVITDIDEVDSELSNSTLSAREHAQSLPNIPFAVSTSTDVESTHDTTPESINDNRDKKTGELSQEEVSDAAVPDKVAARPAFDVTSSPKPSRIPTFSPSTSPLVPRKSEEPTMSKIATGGKQPAKQRTNYRDALRATMNIPGGESTAKLPKLSLFNKK